MKCSFCANPHTLCKTLFQADTMRETNTPISEALICDNCVRRAYRRLEQLGSEHNKITRAAHYKLPISHTKDKST